MIKSLGIISDKYVQEAHSISFALRESDLKLGIH